MENRDFPRFLLVTVRSAGWCGGASERCAARASAVGSVRTEALGMKTLERITLMTATAVYAGYLIQQALKTRAERLYRLAAGESPYERAHPKPRRVRVS